MNKPTVEIKSFDQLKSLLVQPLRIPMLLDAQRDRDGNPVGGNLVEFPARRLSSKESEAIRAVARKPVPPPMLNKQGEFKGDYNYADPKYREDSTKAQRQARALAIYMACDWVSQQRSGLVHPEDVQAFVEELLPENVLVVLDAGIQKEGVDVVALANFTLPAGAES